MVMEGAPWYAEFLEMRSFGNTGSLLSAFMYSLLELCVVEQAIPIKSLFGIDAVSEQIDRVLALIPSPNPANKHEIVTILTQFRAILEQKYGSESPELVINSVCAALEVPTSLFNLRRNSAESHSSRLNLAWSDTGVVYILYPNLTFESFIDLPCGHFDVKFKYFQKIRGIIENRAVNYEELATLDVLSDCCNANISQKIALLLFKPHQNDRFHPSNCQICGKRPISTSNLCKKHVICRNCACKTYFTHTWILTPCCKTLISDEKLREIHAEVKEMWHLMSVVARLRQVREMERMNIRLAQTPPLLPTVKSQNCRSCGQIYTPNDTYQCPSACQCTKCTVESCFYGETLMPCTICSFDFSKNIKIAVKTEYRRCHVCGITNKRKYFPGKSECGCCFRCMDMIDMSQSTSGVCFKCKGRGFDVSDREKKYFESRKKLSEGCCEYADRKNLVGGRLECSHLVCKVHFSSLKMCRKCRLTVSR